MRENEQRRRPSRRTVHDGRDLFQIFVLQTHSRRAPSTSVGNVGAVGEQHLIDDDRMRIDVTFGQFLNQSFGFVERQELGNANADERRQILQRTASRAATHGNRHELTGFWNWSITCRMTASVSSSLFDISSAIMLSMPNMAEICNESVELVDERLSCVYLSQHRTHLILQSENLVEAFLDGRRKREESQCVARRRCIEHDHAEVHVLHQSRSRENVVVSTGNGARPSTYFITSEKLTASSMPGNDESISWNIDRPTVHSSKANRVRRSRSCRAVRRFSPLSSLSSGSSLMPPDGSISYE
jgi:hypothetical protein